MKNAIIITLAMVIGVLLININSLKQDEKMYQSQILKIREMRDESRENYKIIKESLLNNYKRYKMTATVYHPVKGQCDDYPDIMANGEKIDIRIATDLKIIAISQEHLKRNGGDFKFGDYVYIIGTPDESDGVYQIKDTMSKRMRNKIDILKTEGGSVFKEEVVLIKL